MSFLNSDQKQQFIEDGYIVVSGLIAAAIVDETREKICRAVGISIDDPTTWPDTVRGARIDERHHTTACLTLELDSAARELVGDSLWKQHSISSFLSRSGEPPFVQTMTPVLAYPQPGEKKFVAQWPGGFHVDGMHLASLWPSPNSLLLIALVYLTDTAEYGGATAVVPGSHRRIFEYWAQRGEAPTGAQALQACVENPHPVAANGAAGDVLFMHRLLVHSGTMNRDDHVRVAINGNLAMHPERPYKIKRGAPQDDWTPLDWTLRTDNIEVGSQEIVS